MTSHSVNNYFNYFSERAAALIPYAKEAGGILLLVVLAASHGCAYRQGGSKARAEQAKQSAAYERQLAHAVQVARDTERKAAQDIAAIANQYEQDKADAQAKHDHIVAGLRSGQLRLRQHWQGCPSVPGAASGASEPDAAAELRATDAGAAIRDADEADAIIRGLQKVTEADRSNGVR